MPKFPPCPPDLKYIAHFLKVAEEHDERNVVISYWSRMYACQEVMRCMPGKKPPNVLELLASLMDWLEETKKKNNENDGITNETAAQALIEEYTNQLFNYGNTQDHAKTYSKNVVKAFYTCGILLDVLQQFGPLSEHFLAQRKYSKWKAAYIHNCLKRGEEPIPGPPREVFNPNLMSAEDFQEVPEDTLGTLLPPKEATEPPATFPMYDPEKTKVISFHQEYEDVDDDDDEEEGPVPNLHPFARLPPKTPPVEQQPEPKPSVEPAEKPAEPVSPQSSLDAEKIAKAQKYCKWAGSALNYDDVKTAVDNLQKALHLLQFGEEK